MNRVIPVVAVLALLAAIAPAAGANQVAAEFLPESGVSSFGSFGREGSVEARGQAFEASTSGRLVSVMFRCARIGDHAIPLRVSVFAVDEAALPVGEAIASQTFAADLLPVDGSGALITFEFGSTEAALIAGQRYAVVAEPVTPTPEGSTFFMVGAGGDGAVYPQPSTLRFGSSSWSASEATDFVFQVTVDESVPAEGTSWSGLKRLGT